MKALSDKLDNTLFYFRGYPTLIDKADFFSQVHNRKNFIFEGQYTYPDDLEDIYSKVHFTWAFEFVNEDYNSKWLLPNRLYEGGLFNKPLLAPEDFYIGKVVKEMGIGWTFCEPYTRNLLEFLEEVSESEYCSKVNTLSKIPRSHFLVTNDINRLLDNIL